MENISATRLGGENVNCVAGRCSDDETFLAGTINKLNSLIGQLNAGATALEAKADQLFSAPSTAQESDNLRAVGHGISLQGLVERIGELEGHIARVNKVAERINAI